MRRHLALLFLALLTTIAHAAPRAAHVIVVGVDGLSPRGIDQSDTPNIDRMLVEGARTFHARAVLPTSSSSNWASMIMGAGPEHHGVTSNGWERGDHTIQPTVTGPEPIFPTIFSVLRGQRPDATIAVSYDWGGFGRLFEHSAVDHAYDGEGPDDTIDKALEWIASDTPDLLFIHLDQVDHAGHSHGWHTAHYVEAVEHADRLLGRIRKAVQDAGVADDTVIILTSDHGGIAHGHGGETMDEIEIPWIIAGAGIAPGREITRPVATYDTASTVAYLLGVNQPVAWVGRPVVSALTEGPAGARFYATAPYIRSPRITPDPGLYKQNTVRVEFVDIPRGAAVRYTTDGSEPTPASTIYTEPITLDADATVRAKLYIAGYESIVVTNRYRVVSPDQPRRVSFSYYEYEGGDRESIPELDAMTPVAQGVVPHFGLNFLDTRRDDHFAVRFRGTFLAPKAGRYAFYLTSDDGSKLYINGKVAIDNDGSHGATERIVRLDLPAGPVALVVDYYENYGGEALELAYAPPGGDRRVLGHADLKPIED